MAKSKSLQTQISNHFPIPLFTVSYRPFWVRGAKHLIQRDENGKITFNSKNTRISRGIISPGKFLDDENEKKFLAERKEEYEKLGYKDVKFKKLSIDLPRKCPDCHRPGSPTVNEDTRFEVKRETFLLKYRHSTKPETHYVGTISFSDGVQINLKKSLPIGSLGYSSRIGTFQ